MAAAPVRFLWCKRFPLEYLMLHVDVAISGAYKFHQRQTTWFSNTR
jgi:hypothetical protein